MCGKHPSDPLITRRQVRQALAHTPHGLSASARALAGNGTHGTRRVECQPSNTLGPAKEPCLFDIVVVGG